jgi:hypothetical protein
MLSKIKTYLMIGAILIIAAAFVTVNIQAKKIKALKADNSRLSINNSQLLTDSLQQMTITLRQKEITGRLKIERDSLAAVIRIKPKQIDHIVYLNNFYTDTVKIEIPAMITGKNEWHIRDSTKCLKVAYKAKLDGDSLNVIRELLSYNNKTTQTFYKKRPHKFLFIRWGRWQYLQKIDSECGEVKYQNFIFIK